MKEFNMTIRMASLMISVTMKLTNKAAEVCMLEVSRQNLSGEQGRVGNLKRDHIKTDEVINSASVQCTATELNTLVIAKLLQMSWRIPSQHTRTQVRS